jgi:transposase
VWKAKFSGTISGVFCRSLFPGVARASAVRAETRGGFSRRSCAWRVQAVVSVIYRNGSGGRSDTVKRRYYRWIEQGIFDRIFEAVSHDPDMEWVAIDATVVRAQAQAAGARQKGGQEAQALGRSRGGFGTKISVVVEALGLPVRFDLGPGQQNDMACAADLIDGLQADNVLADKAYDTDSLCAKIEAQGGVAVIPPRRHRNNPRAYDRIAYKKPLGRRRLVDLRSHRHVLHGLSMPPLQNGLRVDPVPLREARDRSLRSL